MWYLGKWPESQQKETKQKDTKEVVANLEIKHQTFSKNN